MFVNFIRCVSAQVARASNQKGGTTSVAATRFDKKNYRIKLRLIHYYLYSLPCVLFKIAEDFYIIRAF